MTIRFTYCHAVRPANHPASGQARPGATQDRRGLF
jgi:hypothetical protein